ncbi:MAG: ATPase domain-containing protein [Candidatus Njordarchaeales archaeon]
MLERVYTGIEGLDCALGGGFVRGSLILVEGNPGTGKTILGATFLYNGIVKYGENGIYLNFIERKRDFYARMRSLGMNFEPLEKEGKFEYIEGLYSLDIRGLENIFKLLVEKIFAINAKRLVIDSVSAVIYGLKEREIRAFLSNTISRILRSTGVTTMLISDLPYGKNVIENEVGEFIADTVIMMKQRIRPDRITNVMEVRKSRGKTVKPYVLPYIITGRGFYVVSPLSTRLYGRYSKEILETGISALDNRLSGGLLKGSTTLIVGPSGTGKTLLALTIAVNNIRKGKRVIITTFKEPDEILKEYLIRLGVDESELDKKVRILSLNPFGSSEYEILYIARRAVEEFKPDIYILDGLEIFEAALGKEEAFNYTYRRIQELKSAGLTIILVKWSPNPKQGDNLYPLMDNILITDIMWEKTRYRKLLWIVKSRSEGGEILSTPLMIKETSRSLLLSEAEE